MSAEVEPAGDQLPLGYARALAAVRPVQWPRYVVGAGGIAYGILIILAVGTGSFELIEAIPLIPLLGYLSLRLGRAIAARDRDPAMEQFVLAAFSAKMIGTLVRALVVSLVYDNRSDSLDYHEWGKFFAPAFRGFDFSQVVSWSGTDFMRTATGVVYSFTGASQVSGSLVFSFLSFIGLLLLWRAFQRAVPDGFGRRYAILVLFLPSFLYWPSSLGKEGWAIFCLGLASYGVARTMTRSILPGIILVAAGLFGVTLLRPHVALTIFAGILLAAACGKSQLPGAKSSALRLVLFGALGVTFVVLASSTASFFGVPSLNQETINATLNNAEGRTSEAGSSFTPVTMSNPANFPIAAFTVLFRPLPIEASSVVAAASALEGVFLMGLVWTSRRRLRAVFRCMRNRPYVAYCVGIMLTFIYAFSAFSNFGILARQRCQVLPFFLALLCLPEWTREGVITTEAALQGRDEEPVEPPSRPGDPYSQVPADPTAGEDPYSKTDFGFDPYERFRDPSIRHPTDHV